MKELLILKKIVIRIGYMIIGGLLAIGFVFPDYLADIHDYQIIYQDLTGSAITIYARGERKGLLGQHETIVFSPENIASRNWSYNPSRDLRYVGEDYVLYKIENGWFHIYSQQILSSIDYSQWNIPIRQETMETKRKLLIQENSRKNGYNIISVNGMTE
ncbi:MAG: hypothetical protein IJ611_09005 [Bacteroidales bacterium]|nr:hypothetical protein [Bacteroidales bacterium]